MSTPEFATAENNQELAQEVNCLKALLTLMLQAFYCVKSVPLPPHSTRSASCWAR